MINNLNLYLFKIYKNLLWYIFVNDVYRENVWFVDYIKDNLFLYRFVYIKFFFVMFLVNGVIVIVDIYDFYVSG